MSPVSPLHTTYFIFYYLFQLTKLVVTVVTVVTESFITGNKAFSVTTSVTTGIGSGDRSVLERDLSLIPVYLFTQSSRFPILGMSGGFDVTLTKLG